MVIVAEFSCFRILIFKIPTGEVYEYCNILLSASRYIFLVCFNNSPRILQEIPTEIPLEKQLNSKLSIRSELILEEALLSFCSYVFTKNFFDLKAFIIHINPLSHRIRTNKELNYPPTR